MDTREYPRIDLQLVKLIAFDKATRITRWRIVIALRYSVRYFKLRHLEIGNYSRKSALTFTALRFV